MIVMRETERRVAHTTRTGGPHNAVFVVWGS